jgi:MFS family permease
MKKLPIITSGVALMFEYSLTTFAFSFFVVPVCTDLNFDRGIFSLYLTIMMFTSMITAPFVGYIVNRVGLRRFMLIGCFLNTGCLVLFSFCNSLRSFYYVGAVMGLSSTAATNIVAVIIINLWIPENNGTYMGIVMAGTGLGGAIMSIILPYFLNVFGWRSSYILLAIIWCMLSLLAIILTGDRPNHENESTSPKTHSSNISKNNTNFAQVIHSPVLYLFIAAIFLLTLGGNFLQHMPAYFTELGTAQIISGIIMSVLSFSLMLIKILEGFIFDKVRSTRFTSICSILFALGFGAILINKLVALFIGAILMSTGMALIAVMPPLMASNLFGQQVFPAVWGIISLVISLGKAVSTPGWGMLYDKLGSYRPGLIVMPFLLLIAGALLFLAQYCSKRPTMRQN